MAAGQDGKTTEEAVPLRIHHGQVDTAQAETEKPAQKAPVKVEHTLWSRLVLWCAIINGAYMGLLVRIGTTYMDTGLGGLSNALMYANILGSIVMGFTVAHEKLSHQSRTHHIVYVAIASGFCGSLTTFSGLSIEATKLLFRQFDPMSMQATKGAFVWQWIFYLWSGVVVPLCALRMGQHIALMSPFTSVRFEPQRASYLWVEISLLIFFVLGTVAIMTAPLEVSPVRYYLTESAAMGAAGALLRYFLSVSLNPCVKGFPLGTFIANLFGTMVILALTLIAKFSVHPADYDILASYYALIVGFCGCLTTISSFVNELHSLGQKNLRHAYTYGLTSVLLPQAICILVFALVALAQVPKDLWSDPPRLDMCAAYNLTCFKALRSVGCPTKEMVIESCRETHPDNPALGLTSFVGECTCGDYDIGWRMGENLIDVQIRQNVTRTMVPIWPTDSRSTPTHTYDLCASFDMTCEDLLNRIGCPVELQTRDACGGLSVEHYRGICACGTMQIGSVRVAELNLDTTLNNKLQDLASWTRYSDSPVINFCEAYLDICHKVMAHIQCKDEWRHIDACDNMTDLDTFVGNCACGDFYIFPSDRVNEIVIDSQSKVYTLWTLQRFQSERDMPKGFERAPDGQLPFDMCRSFDLACTDLLDRIACPNAQRKMLACNSTMLEWVGQCGCGANDEAPGDRLTELLIDQAVYYHILPYLYDLPHSNPFTALVQSDFLKPLQVYTNVQYWKGYAPFLEEVPWLTNVPYPE